MSKFSMPANRGSLDTLFTGTTRDTLAKKEDILTPVQWTASGAVSKKRNLKFSKIRPCGGLYHPSKNDPDPGKENVEKSPDLKIFFKSRGWKFLNYYFLTQRASVALKS